MRILTLFFALLTTACFSCSKEEEAVTLRTTTAPAPVVQVDVPETAVTAGEGAGLKVYFTVINGCGEFGSFEESLDGQTLTVKVYPHYSKGFCTQALETKEVTYTFKPETNGIYTLRFWAGEDTFISKTIVVQ